VLAPDLRGHGDSQIVPGPYSMDLFADDLNAFLDALDIDEPIFLCGLSMGGYAAFAFTRKYPQRLRGLILSATRAAPDSPQARAGRDQSAETARRDGAQPIIDGMAPKMLAPKTVQARPQLLEAAKAIMRRTTLETILADLQALKARPDSTPTLAQIAVPTLIVHGADDQIVPLAEAQAMQAGIRAASLVPLPDAGHLLNIEQPELFNQAVQEFIRSH
jgi:pimeloyl-ACP methyl ester carboxylesterase